MTQLSFLKPAFTLLESIVMLAAVAILTLLLIGMLKAPNTPPEAMPPGTLAPSIQPTEQTTQKAVD